MFRRHLPPGLMQERVLWSARPCAPSDVPDLFTCRRLLTCPKFRHNVGPTQCHWWKFATNSVNVFSIFHRKRQHGQFITVTTSNGKRNVTVRRPSVCPVRILTVTRQEEAAYDAASVHFGSTKGGPTYLFLQRNKKERYKKAGNE